MRHRKKTIKLGRKSEHLKAMLASLVCNLIAVKRVVTTLQKAKAARSIADKMVTLGKRGTLAARRRAISVLRRKDRVALLFSAVAPAFADRKGGYTRIVKLGRRASDSSEMAVLEWVNYIPRAPKKKKKEEKETTTPQPEEKTSKENEKKTKEAKV